MKKITSPVVMKHRLVAKALRDEIASGLWPTGDCIPSEQELARRFEVAHMTIRQAVSSLVDDGVLRRVQGKGTFVLDTSPSLLPGHTRFPMAFLIPPELRFCDAYYFPEVMAGFRAVMEERGHRPNRVRAGLTAADLRSASTQIRPDVHGPQLPGMGLPAAKPAGRLRVGGVARLPGGHAAAE